MAANKATKGRKVHWTLLERVSSPSPSRLTLKRAVKPSVKAYAYQTKPCKPHEDPATTHRSFPVAGKFSFSISILDLHVGFWSGALGFVTFGISGGKDGRAALGVLST